MCCSPVWRSPYAASTTGAKAGWLLLVSLIPVAGVAYLLYLFSLDGQKKLNAWGANPKF